MTEYELIEFAVKTAALAGLIYYVARHSAMRGMQAGVIVGARMVDRHLPEVVQCNDLTVNITRGYRSARHMVAGDIGLPEDPTP